MQKKKDSHLTGRKSLMQFDYSLQTKKLQKMIDCEKLNSVFQSIGCNFTKSEVFDKNIYN